MANSHINQHFFQPLLPGFHTHLNIPLAFSSKHIHNQNKTVKLRSDASDKTWLVKVDGLTFTEGWEDFVAAHDLRIGDITVFRHEGEMVFHVTPLGPSCCEIQYAPPLSTNNNHNNDTGDSSRVKKNPSEKGESSTDQSCFVAKVSPSSLSNDRMYLPLAFAISNGLHKMDGERIILLNEQGRQWNLNVRCNNSGKHIFVKPGFRQFCIANGMSRGHYTFKLVQKCGPPVIRLCRAQSSNHSCFVGSVTSSSLDKDKLYLPKGFVISNGLNKGCLEVVLKNEWGGRWTLAVKHYGSHDHTLLKGGWTSFCQVNGIKAGDSFMLKLAGTEEKPVLLWSRADSSLRKTPLDIDHVNSLSSDPGSSKTQENEKDSRGDSQECLGMEKRKNFSSSYSESHFVTLTLTPYALKNYHLVLPMGFTRVNGINKPGKLTLVGQDGVKWVVDLLQNKSTKAMRFGKGWREFCAGQGVKTNETFVLELTWENEASPVLKFITKLNSA